MGPSFAAAAPLFGPGTRPLDGPFFFTTFRWSGQTNCCPPPFPAHFDLGAIWTIGAGHHHQRQRAFFDVLPTPGLKIFPGSRLR
jgi:hypothetical protein